MFQVITVWFSSGKDDPVGLENTQASSSSMKYYNGRFSPRALTWTLLSSALQLAFCGKDSSGLANTAYLSIWCQKCQSTCELWASSSSSSFRWEKKYSIFWWLHSRCCDFHWIMPWPLFEFEILWNNVLPLLLPVHLRTLFWGLTFQLCIKKSYNGAGDIQHLYTHLASRKLVICVIKEVFPQHELQFSLLAAETQ